MKSNYFEMVPKKEINIVYMCRKGWKWQSGNNCWSWAVSTALLERKSTVLSTLCLKVSMVKSWTKTETKTPSFLAHGPWRVYGPSSTVGRPLALTKVAFLVFKEPGPISPVLASQCLLCQRPSLMILWTQQRRVVLLSSKSMLPPTS